MTTATADAVLGVPRLMPPVRGDRHTVIARGQWERTKYERVEVRTVEVMDAPPGKRFVLSTFMRAVDRDRELYNRRTGKLAPVRTRHVSVEVSFHDVKPSRDWLGGFTTGACRDWWPETWLEELPKWQAQGFTPRRTA